MEEKGRKVNELSAEARVQMGETMNAAIAGDIRTSVGDEFYDGFMQNFAE